jgi:hypothetical protein
LGASNATLDETEREAILHALRSGELDRRRGERCRGDSRSLKWTTLQERTRKLSISKADRLSEPAPPSTNAARRSFNDDHCEEIVHPRGIVAYGRDKT